eukprot:16447082-Heterocapsa_arctica.AAC.1
MGIDERIIHFLTALDADTIAGVFLRGEVWGYINMERGVRQGRRASGTMFAICCDLIFRWLAERAAHRNDQMRAYADDVAFAILSMRISMPRLALAFSLIEKATGLWLKHK